MTDLYAAVEQFVPHVMRQNGTPGLSIAIVHHGEHWEAGFGLADVASGRPFTAGTTVPSGSIGKVYTATAVMRLVESGVVGLDDAVEPLLGIGCVNPLGGRDVTVTDLMTHRSGLSENGACCTFGTPAPLGEHLKGDYARSHNDFYAGSVLETWSAPVGEAYQYSNTGIATLGLLVERLNPEGLSFSDYVQRHVLDPLQLPSAVYPPVQDADHVPSHIWDRMATGYTRIGDVRIPTPHIALSDFAAGGMVFTAGDHARFLAAYLRGGDPILWPATVDDMLTTRGPTEAGGQVGLVWHLDGDRFFHPGAHMWGWTNGGHAWRDLDLAVVVFANQWNLLEGVHAPRYPESDLLAAFVARLVADPSQLAKVFTPWSWKLSYLTGLTVAERIAALGIHDELPVDAMLAGVRGDLDPDGFRAGVADIARTDRTPQGIKTFVESSDLRVARAELDALHRELGGVGGPVTWSVS